MFTSNPWGDYITMLAPLIAGYYLFIGLKFYGRDLKKRLTSKRSSSGRLANMSEQDFDVPDPPPVTFAYERVQHVQKQETPVSPDVEDDIDQSATWQNEELFDQLELLAGHLKEAIEEAHEKEYGKQDLTLLLQMTLKEYPAMSAQPFVTAINNLIETECAKYGSIHLREQDLAAVWKQVV